MGFLGQQTEGVTVVQHRMVKVAALTGRVVSGDGLRQRLRVQPQLEPQLLNGVGFFAGKNRRHEPAHGFAVNDRVTALAGLLCHQPTPNGVALGPEVFAFVVEALAILIDDDAQRNAVHPGANTAVVQRRTRIHGHRVTLGWITDRVRTLCDEVFEQNTHVETRAADRKVVGRPVAGFVLSPGLSQPFPIGFKTATGNHASLGMDQAAIDLSGHKATVFDDQAVNR